MYSVSGGVSPCGILRGRPTCPRSVREYAVKFGRSQRVSVAVGLVCWLLLAAAVPARAGILVGTIAPHSPDVFWGSQEERKPEAAYQPLDPPPLHPNSLALLDNEEAVEAFTVWLSVLMIPPSLICDYFNPPPVPPPPGHPTSSPPDGGGGGGGSNGPGSPPPPPPLQTPEPGTLLLGMVGAGLLGLMRWRRNAAAWRTR